MSDNHTPAPWLWANDEYEGLYGAGANSPVLEFLRYEGMHLAYVLNRDANARLIAAAPDLLQALREVLMVFEMQAHTASQLTAIRASLAAIAKATKGVP